MNRAVKFRGIDVNIGKWHYGYLVPHMNDSISKRSIKVYDTKVERAWGVEFEVILETIGEFSGLLDKNGVEIYEGDIVRYWNGTIHLDENGCIEYAGKRWSKTAEITKEVVFIDGCFCLKDDLPLNCYINEEALEVIGNIYDNPELLEVEKCQRLK
jgi:uncharacterized phage protein (TIGR01671 family)